MSREDSKMLHNFDFLDEREEGESAEEKKKKTKKK